MRRWCRRRFQVAAPRHLRVPGRENREQVCDSMVSALTYRMFQGDVAALVNHLLTDAEISPGDLARVKRLISRKAKQSEATDV